MSGSFINGMVSINASSQTGNKYSASVLSQDPYAVAVTFSKMFDASKPPVGVASVAGAPGDDSAQSTFAVQVSNTSLTFALPSGAEPVPFYFMVTDKGLGYY